MAKRSKQKQKGKGGGAAKSAESQVDVPVQSADVAEAAETAEPSDAPVNEAEAADAASAALETPEHAPPDVAEAPAAVVDEPEAQLSAASEPKRESKHESKKQAARASKRRRARDTRTPLLVLADYEQRSLAHVAGLPEELEAPGLWRGVAYRIGTHRLASGFDEVLEILPMPTITHVPGALPWMLGVANIRGTLLPIVDLKQFLEGERTVLHERQRVLVVRQPAGDVAVTIDELYGQRSFVDEQSTETTTIADGRYTHFVDRAYHVQGQDWGIFSLDRLTRTPEFRQAAA